MPFEQKLSEFIARLSKESPKISDIDFKANICWFIKVLSDKKLATDPKDLKSFSKIVRLRLLGYLIAKYGEEKLKNLYNRISQDELDRLRALAKTRYSFSPRFGNSLLSVHART